MKEKKYICVTTAKVLKFRSQSRKVQELEISTLTSSQHMIQIISMQSGMMIYEGGIGSGCHGEPNIHGIVSDKVFQGALSCDKKRT